MSLTVDEEYFSRKGAKAQSSDPPGFGRSEFSL